MPCAECQNRDSIIAQLKATLEERDQQLSEANAKLTKQKLQSKAKFTQLKHQILENIAEKEGPVSQKVVENLLSKLDDTENQLYSCREELDGLKFTLAKKEQELDEKNETIQTLETSVNQLQEHRSSHQPSRRPPRRRRRSESDVTSEEEDADDDEDIRDRMSQMYAQMVYKDSKIVELNDIILRRDQKILDLQESCRERDEVIWAKTKAVQVFQEKLNFYANRDFRDIATETAAFIHDDVEANSADGPGHAVAYYRSPDSTRRADDDESTSITTEIRLDPLNSLVERFTELAEAVRNATNGVSNASTSTLNTQLSEMMQQIELAQKRITALESSDRLQQQPKKKREKKVTFDFTSEQERAELAAVTEKLNQTEQACMDLREENDDFRLTIADLERQLASYEAELTKAESNRDLDEQLHSALERINAMNIQLGDKENQLHEAERQADSLSSYIHDLQHQLDDLRRTIAMKETEKRESITVLEAQLRETHSDNIKLIKQKEAILSDVDDLREAIETSQQLINGLENDLQTAHSELDHVRGLSESQRREHLDTVATLQRDLTTQKLNAKAYETKLRNVERENERLSDLIKAQQQEWTSLRTEGKEEVTGFRLKAKAYEAKFRILHDDNERLEKLVVDLKSVVDTLHNEKTELTREYDRKLTEFEQEAKENLALIERAMTEQRVEIETLKAELSSEARLKTKAYEAKWKSIERENERLIDAVNDLTKSLEQRQAEKEQLLNELSRLKDQLSYSTNDGKRQEHEIADLKETLELSGQRENEFRTNLEKLQSSLGSKNFDYCAVVEELSEAQSNIQSLRVKLETSTTQLDQAKDQIRVLNDEKQDLETDLHRLWDIESTLKRRIGEMERAQSQLRDDNVALRSRCLIAENEEQKLEDMTTAHERLKQDHSRLKEKVEFLEAASTNEAGRLANELQQYMNNVAQLEHVKSELEKELRFSKQRELDVNEDKNHLEQLNSTISSEMNNLKTLLQTTANENSELKSALENCAADNGTVIQKLHVANLDLERRLQHVDAENLAMRRQLDVAREEISTSERRLQTMADANEAFQTKIRTLEHQILVLEDRISNELQQMSTSSNLQSTTSNYPDSEIEHLRLERDQLAADLSQLKSAHNSALVELDTLREEMNQGLDANDREITMLQEHIRQLEKDTATTNNQFQQLKESADGLLAELAEVKAQNLRLSNDRHINADSKSEELQKENENLQLRLEEAQNQYLAICSHLQDVQSENKLLSDSMRQLENDREKLGEERQSLCAEIVALNEKLSISDLLSQSLKQDIESILEENEHLRTVSTPAHIDAVEDHDEKSELVAQLERKNQDIQEEYQRLMAYYDQLQSAYAVIYQQYEELQKKPATRDAETEIDQPETNKDTTDSNAIVQSGGSPGRGNTPDQSRSEMIKLKAKLRKMEKTMEALEAKNKYLQDENAALDKKATDLEERLPTIAPTQDAIQDGATSDDVAEEKIDVSNVQQSTAQPQPMLVQSPTPHTNPDAETERKIAMAISESRGLQQHISILVQQLDVQKAKYEEAREQLSRSDNEKLRLKNNLDESVDTLELLKQELAVVKQLCQSMDSEKQTLQRQLNELSGRETELKKNLEERSNAFASFQTASLESNAAVKTEIEELTVLNVSLKEELTNVLNERDRAQEKVRRLLASTDELEIINHDLTEKIHSLEKRCSELELIPAAHEENVELKKRMQDLVAMLQKWEHQVTTLESTVQNLSSENQRLVLTEKSATFALEEAKEAFEKLQTESGQLKEDNSFLRSIMEELESKNNQLQDEIDAISAKYKQMEPLQDLVAYHKQLEQRFHEEIEKSEAAEKKSEELQGHLRKAKENETSALEKVAAVQVEFENLKMELQRIAQKNATEDASINTDVEINQLEQELNETVQQLKLIDDQLEKEKSERIRLEQELKQTIQHFSSVNELLAKEKSERNHLEQELKQTIEHSSSVNEQLAKEKSDLEERLETVMWEMDDQTNLKATLEELRSSNQQLLDNNEQLLMRCDELENHIEEITAESTESTMRQESLQRDLDALTISLEAAAVEAKEKEATIASLQAQLEQLQSTLQDQRQSSESTAILEQQIVKLSSALSTSQDELATTKHDCDTIRSLYEQLYAAYGQLEATNRNLLDQMEIFKNEGMERERDMDALKASAIDDRRTADRAVKDLETAKRSIGELKSESERLTSELKATTTRIQELESSIQQLDRELANSAATVGGLESRNVRLDSDLVHAQQKIECLSTSLRISLDRCSRFSDAFTKIGLDPENMDDIHVYLETLLHERDSLNRQRLDLASKVDSIQVTSSNYEHELRQLKEKLEHASNEERLSKEHCARLEKNVETWREKYRHLENETSLKNDKIRTLEQELNATNDEFGRLQFERQQWHQSTQQLDDLQHKLQSAEKMVAEKSARMANLENELENARREKNANMDARQLLEQVEILKSEVLQRERESDELKAVMANLELQNSTLSTENAILVQQRRDSTQQLDEIRHKLLSTEQTAAEKSARLEDLQTELENLKRLDDANALEQVELLKNEVMQRERDTDALKGLLEQRNSALSTENSILNQRLDQFNVEYAALQERIQNMDLDNIELRNRLDESQAAVNVLVKQLDEQQQQDSDLVQRYENQQTEMAELTNQLEDQNAENAQLKKFCEEQKSTVAVVQKHLDDRTAQSATLQQSLENLARELGDAKGENDRLLENLKEKDLECIHLNESVFRYSEEIQRLQLEFDEKQRHAMDVQVSQMALAQESEFRQQIARLQNDFALEHARLQEELTKAVREKQEALQWLEQERPKYTSSIRNLGELKEHAAQQQRQLESSYLKLAEVDVMKEQIRESEAAHERAKMEKKELSVQFERLRQDYDSIQQQLANDRNELEILRRQSNRSAETLGRSSSQSESDGQPNMDSMQSSLQTLAALKSENERLRDELKAAEKKNAYLLNRYRELEYQQTYAKRRSPSPERYADVESGSEYGDTVSLTPAETASNRDRSLQLRRETLGSLSGDRSLLKSAQLWLRSKIRKYPYLTRRRPSLLKLLVVAYAFAIHLFVFICWFH